MFRSAVEKAGMRLFVDCQVLGEPVYVDRDMWEKIVLNLVSNAFKFTLEGEIEVRLSREADGARLIVRDTGSGISTEQLPHIFERFHRVEGTRARTHEGTGIGLALVQELVRLHGGTIGVESVVGQGTTFSVTIPFGRSHLPADRIGAVRKSASTVVGAERLSQWKLCAGCPKARRRLSAGRSSRTFTIPGTRRRHRPLSRGSCSRTIMQTCENTSDGFSPIGTW